MLYQRKIGIKILGTPLGHPDFIVAFLESITEMQKKLTKMIPLVTDTQSAWVLLTYCANARANYYTRCSAPDLTQAFAKNHDDVLWNCFLGIIGLESSIVDEKWRHLCQASFSASGLGL